MKKYFISAIFILLIGCSSHGTRPGLIIVKTKYRIAPKRVGKVSYKTLQRMDKNNDGFINALDFGEKPDYKNARDIIDAYVYYLNNYRVYDVAYGHYLDNDLNKNGKIDSFEIKFDFYKKKEAKSLIDNFIRNLKPNGKIGKEQIYKSYFIAYNYRGINTRYFASKISSLKPGSNYRFLVKNNNAGFDPDLINQYNFKNKDTRYLTEMLVASPLVTFLKTKNNALGYIIKNSKRLFPSMFYSRNLMLAFISKIQANLYEKKAKLHKVKDATLIKQINDSFNNLDIIYAYITPLKNLTNFHYDIVEKYKNDLAKYIGAIKVKNYESALSVLKRFIRAKRITKYYYHFVIAALFKLKISNKKPMHETDYSFSPDMLFKKGYGVCADQSLVFRIFMRDLLGISSGKIYLWFRKNYWNHLSMIYKNLSGNYYIFDNYGIQRVKFSKLKHAIRFHTESSFKYIASVRVDKRPCSNKSWQKVETGKKRCLATKDGKYRIVFSKPVLVKN